MSLGMVLAGYVLGLVLGSFALAEIRRLGHRTFRRAGRSQRRWVQATIIGMVTGWGGVIVAAAWFLGYARRDVVDALSWARD